LPVVTNFIVTAVAIYFFPNLSKNVFKLRNGLMANGSMNFVNVMELNHLSRPAPLHPPHPTLSTGGEGGIITF
jgi:hypothetical protein